MKQIKQRTKIVGTNFTFWRDPALAVTIRANISVMVGMVTI
ncbi:MAG: hypothetical protein WC614_03100 [bacterium]